jgi:hypothetical protein
MKINRWADLYTGSTVDEETLVEYEREYAGQVSW